MALILSSGPGFSGENLRTTESVKELNQYSGVYAESEEQRGNCIKKPASGVLALLVAVGILLGV